MAKRKMSAALDLSKASKEELVMRIKELEAAQSQIQIPSKKKKNRDLRPFDFSAYPKRHLALKIMYLGWDYHGFASQISFKPGSEAIPDLNSLSENATVEECLFKAMMIAKLIENPGSANYSRCGRTDAGVSSTGQVIACTLRISGKQLSEVTDESASIDLPLQTILNSLLPPDIRVLDITEAPEGLNARFDCKFREYHYYFPRGHLDIEAMKKAANYLLGSHDFRNFCKRDPSKVVENYVRNILESRIEPVDYVPSIEGPQQMLRYVIKGTAFLYHQVRCTMAVLYLVGEGRYSPEIVPDLLNNLHEDWRPTFRMASEIPLVLVTCGYDKIDFAAAKGNEQWRADAKRKLDRLLWRTWRDKMCQALTLQALLPGVLEADATKPEENAANYPCSLVRDIDLTL